MSGRQTLCPAQRTRRLAGFTACMAVGFGCYYGLPALSGKWAALDYFQIVEGIADQPAKQALWFLMNFAEPQFYAGIFSGAGIILGGCAAWLFQRCGGGRRMFPLCQDPALFPWVLASQLLSLGLSLFVFGTIVYLREPGITWAATFIPVVSAPPAVLLLYGPSVRTLAAGSLLGGLFCAPTAVWLHRQVIAPLGLPGVIASVLAMAVCGAAIGAVCGLLPGIPKRARTQQKPTEQAEEMTVLWMLRRTLADFSEAQFYGSEPASVGILLGVLLDWLLCGGHPVYGTGLLPAILLAQVTGSAAGVLLYAGRGRSCPTFIPVVSAAPACVLLYGPSLAVALLAGLSGAVLGVPLARLFALRLPESVPPTVANVLSMAVTTWLTAVLIGALPFFP